MENEMEETALFLAAAQTVAKVSKIGASIEDPEFRALVLRTASLVLDGMEPPVQSAPLFAFDGGKMQ